MITWWQKDAALNYFFGLCILHIPQDGLDWTYFWIRIFLQKKHMLFFTLAEDSHLQENVHASKHRAWQSFSLPRTGKYLQGSLCEIMLMVLCCKSGWTLRETPWWTLTFDCLFSFVAHTGKPCQCMCMVYSSAVRYSGWTPPSYFGLHLELSPSYRNHWPCWYHLLGGGSPGHWVALWKTNSSVWV